MDEDPTPVPDRRHRDDRGASLVEYAMLLALIAVVCIAAVSYFGETAGGSFNTSADSIVNAG